MNYNKFRYKAVANYRKGWRGDSYKHSLAARGVGGLATPRIRPTVYPEVQRVSPVEENFAAEQLQSPSVPIAGEAASEVGNPVFEAQNPVFYNATESPSPLDESQVIASMPSVATKVATPGTPIDMTQKGYDQL